MKSFPTICHTPYTHINQGDSWLLVVWNQIDIMTPNLSFGHNLCCKYLNGSCKPILDIYISKSFQWCKEIFNPMFWPLKSLSKDLGFHKNFNSQGESPLGSVWAHSLTLFHIPKSVNVTLELHFRLVAFHASCLGREPKSKVMTYIKSKTYQLWSITLHQELFWNFEC
jgi:hypothetical protein